MASKDKLTERSIRAAKPARKPYKLFDGGGLYLLIGKGGSRYWRFKYRMNDRERLISLGVYPEQTLADARDARDAARRLVAKGTDPSQARRQAKAAQRTAAENTFEAVAKEWLEKRHAGWKPNHARVVRRRLEKDVFAQIGAHPIATLTRKQLLEVLKKVEGRGAIESARRIRQYLAAVMRYAIHTERMDANPTPHPEALAIPKHQQYASITDPAEVGALMRAIGEYRGTEVVRAALRLAPLLFVRPGELRAACWREIDLQAAEWTIPAEHMKMRRPHIVPLSVQALALLREIEPITRNRGEFVFPSERGATRPMSENTLLAALRSLGYSKEQMTPHGFRHMASTLLHESRKWRSEVIERQLAHADKNSIRAVYNAAEYIEERKAMMQWWADRLDALAATEKVVSIGATRRN